ncbi:MAG TPA: Ig-like domain-containing protein [Blastocatellia bacterium]|nr:Ig-like domain-containing protein [Blastocatellia bacterium]
MTLFLLSLPPNGGTTNFSVEATAQPVTRQHTATKVSILPAYPEAEVGEELQFKTVATDDRGRQTELKAGFWIALPNDLATIDADGKAHLLAPGELQVIAIVNGKQVRSTIKIKPPRLATIKIAKPAAPLPIGESFQLMAYVADAKGGLRKDAPLAWKSENPSIATVDEAGRVTALAVGKVTITANAETVSDRITIEIVKSDLYSLKLQPNQTTAQVGDVVHFTVETQTLAGQPANVANIRLLVDGEALIENDGSFVAKRPGKYTVTASSGDKTSMAIVTITPRTVERQLEIVSQIPLGPIQASQLWPFGNYLYVATFADELRVYDLSDIKTPRLTETLKVDARSLPDFSLTADGRVGVLTREGASNRQNGLLFLDTADLAHPKILSSFTETISGSVHSAFIDGHYVYLTDDATGSMRVVDFSDAKSPKQVARWELALPAAKVQTDHMLAGMSMGSRHLHDVQVKDGLAYLAYWRDGLVILDVGAGLRGGSPENPKFVSQFRFNHTDLYGKGWLAGTREVFRCGKVVFVGDEVIPVEFDPKAGGRRLGRGILHVIDVSDIYNPRRVAEYALPEGGAYNVWADGDWLAVGFYGGGGRILDISGELLGNLAEQGREIAQLKTGLKDGDRQDVPFTFSARIFANHIFFNDLKTGIWITKLGKPLK